MKFLADVNIPQSAIKALLKNHDVLDLKKLNREASDLEVMNIAKLQKRIILTLDKDFIVISQFPKHQVPAIVVRLRSQKSQVISDSLQKFLREQKESIIKKSLTIITEESANSYPY